MKVDLTPEEMRRWAYAGVDRRISAMAMGRKGAHGFDREFEAWQIDIEGLLAEAAVAKALNLWFSPITGELDTHLGDVAPGIQVRSTRHGYDKTNIGNLLIHDSDKDDDRFILVVGSYGKYRIAGWIHGRDGKQEKWKRQHKGRWAYWVQQENLKPFEPKTMK
jgi:hypothetical protein